MVASPDTCLDRTTAQRLQVDVWQTRCLHVLRTLGWPWAWRPLH